MKLNEYEIAMLKVAAIASLILVEGGILWAIFRVFFFGSY